MDSQSTKPPVDARIVALAQRQHGVVARAQLVALGVSEAAIGGRVRKGRLHALHRGVYAVGHLGVTRAGHYMAAVLACGEGAALSHFSAGALWGLLRDRGGAVHVTAEAKRRRSGLIVHQAPLEGERVKRAGITVTTPARTLLDLADVAPRRLLERAMDEADYLRLDCAGLTPRPGRFGSGVVAGVLDEYRAGSTRTRSDLEELFIGLCDRFHLPRPEVNVHIEGYECDFVWREQRLIVETDGAAAHGTRRARERDPVRDADLLVAGWRVIRVTYRRLMREPEAVADQLVRLGITPAPLPAAGERASCRRRASGGRRAA